MRDLIRTPGSIGWAFLRGAGIIAGSLAFPAAVLVVKSHGGWLPAVVIIGVVSLIGGCLWAIPAILYRLSYDRLMRDGWPQDD